jgi:monoamine oxidase
MPEKTIDIAIVGAGVSGLYVAWRLKTQFPAKTVVVFEASERLGGRLLSLRPPEIPNMVAELGGMRILPAVQPRIKKLIDVLNRLLTAGDKIELFHFPVDEPQNLAFLRGVHLRLSDFIQKPEKVPYSLNFLERGMSAGGIIINAIEQIVPGITRKGLSEEERRQMTNSASFDGVPLYLQGFWNVLMRIISGEAYLLGTDAGGYNSTLTNWNAADAIPWYLSDFGVDPEYQGFRKGFQQVPMSLAELFRSAGGEIRPGAPLAGFDEAGNGYSLSVHGKRINAKSLVLAMPRRSLDLLAPSSPPLRTIQELIGSVTPRPLFKLFTTYNNPWWRAAGFNDGAKFVSVESGRSITDLPVRQTYYWPNDDGTPAREGPAMLMASYDDGANIGFWDGLRPRRGHSAPAGREVATPKNAFLGPADALIGAGSMAAPAGEPGQSWSDFRAPTRMVEEVARQLAMIHGLSYTPEVRTAAFRDWGEDPFGGGWNSWNIGVKSQEVKAQIVQPFGNRAFHICGEAYSDAQGWVEGALQTADMVLEKFGIGPL